MQPANNQLLKELGNPIAVEEYLIYKHFENDPEKLLKYYESLFVRFSEDVPDRECLSPLQRRILHRNIIGTKYRVEGITKAVAPNSNELILDAGCGIGAIIIQVITRGGKCYGLDMNLPTLKCAKEIAKRNNVKLNVVNADARYIPFKGCLFDKIVFADV